MKNQDTLHKTQSIIETLQEIHISSNEAISELEQIKRNLEEHRQQESGTKARQREATSRYNVPQSKQQSPDTEDRNMGTKPPRNHVDSVGNKIEVGDTVHILSTGLFKGNKAVVTKIRKVRVSLKLQ